MAARALARMGYLQSGPLAAQKSVGKVQGESVRRTAGALFTNLVGEF
jgi:hypothetical protein